jgi:hypothetical protein
MRSFVRYAIPDPRPDDLRRFAAEVGRRLGDPEYRPRITTAMMSVPNTD